MVTFLILFYIGETRCETSHEQALLTQGMEDWRSQMIIWRVGLFGNQGSLFCRATWAR